MYCRNCSNPIDDNSMVCPRCGQPTGAVAAGQPFAQPPPGQPMYHGMGQPAPPAAGYHPYRVPDPPHAVPGAKTRLAYILLGLFLGGLGIHNFYAGYAGRGIAQLLITLLGSWLVVPVFAVWIWVIVEIITVDKDANGVPMT